MEQLINIIDNNYKYAPGLPTYGLPGLNGENGADGNNIYYTNVLFSETINGDEDFSVYPGNLGIIIDLMENGQYPRTDIVLVLNRKITDGDLFITPNGKLYRYNVENNDLTYLTRLKNWTSQFIDNDALDWPQTWDIKNTENGEDGNHIGSLLSLKNNADTKVNENSFIKLTAINQGNVESLYTYFDTKLNAFHLKADVPIVMSTDVYTRYTDDEVIKRYENYSQVLTENDPITNFINVCKSLSWNLSDFNDDDIYHYMEVNTYIYKQRFNDSNILSFPLLSGVVSPNQLVYGKLSTNDNEMIQLGQAFNHFEVTQKGVTPKILMHIPYHIVDNPNTVEKSYTEILEDFIVNGKNSIYWPSEQNIIDQVNGLCWITYTVTVGGIGTKKANLIVNVMSGDEINVSASETMKNNIESRKVQTNIDSVQLSLDEDEFNSVVSFPDSNQRNVCIVELPYVDGAIFEFEQCSMLKNKSYIGVNVQNGTDNALLKDKYVHKLNIFMDIKDEYDFEYKRHVLKDKLLKIVLHDGQQLYIKTDSYMQYDFTVYKNNKNTIDCYIDDTLHSVKYLQSKNTK